MSRFNYLEARRNILDLARREGFSLTSSPTVLSKKGENGEDLAVDFISKSLEFEDLIIVISGTHGIEGAFGHLLQHKFLEGRLHRTLPPDIGLVLVHALNPWGVSYGRRTDQNNVDVNRGCFDIKPHDNHGYEGWLSIIEPEVIRRYGNPDGLDDLRLKIGTQPNMNTWGKILKEIVCGQYHSPKGLFYGGEKLCWSGSVFKGFCINHLSHAKRVVVIDIHSGLGPFSVGTTISSLSSKDSEDAKRTQDWFGKVAFPNAFGVDVVAGVQGDLLSAVKRWLPNAELTGVALEMGTTSPAVSFPAIVAENHFYHYPERVRGTNPKLVEDELENFRKTFAPIENEHWMSASRGAFLDLWKGAVDGLRGAKCNSFLS